MYLWRSPNLPGTLYVAQGFEATEALYRGLTEDGFIVKLVHAATNAEFQLRGGRLCPSLGSLPWDTVGPRVNGAWDALARALRPLQFRGKERLTDALFPRNGNPTASIFGSRFSLDLSDFIQRHIYAGSYERVESQIVRRLLRPGMTFVDVGANVGYYTALAAEAVGPQGRVLAFEPSEYAFPRLKRMVDANRLTWVTPLECGLAEAPGQIILYGGSENDAFNNHTASMVPSDNPHRRLVETDTLDRVAARLEIDHVDVMKIDVDGFEIQVLRGAQRLLETSRIAVIMLECNEQWFQCMDTSTAEIVQYLKGRGFQSVSRMGRSDNYLFALQPER